MSPSTPAGPGKTSILLGRDEEPHREEQGVAGEEREEQSALHEDDDEAEPEQLLAEVLEEPVWIHPVHAEQHRLPLWRGNSSSRADLTRAAVTSSRCHLRSPMPCFEVRAREHRIPRVERPRSAGGGVTRVPVRGMTVGGLAHHLTGQLDSLIRPVRPDAPADAAPIRRPSTTTDKAPWANSALDGDVNTGIRHQRRRAGGRWPGRPRRTCPVPPPPRRTAGLAGADRGRRTPVPSSRGRAGR